MTPTEMIAALDALCPETHGPKDGKGLYLLGGLRTKELADALRNYETVLKEQESKP